MKKMIVIMLVVLLMQTTGKSMPASPNGSQVLWADQSALASSDPEWLWLDCGDNRWATVAWFNPPEEVLPFRETFGGYLDVGVQGGGGTEILMYAGKSGCPLYEGCEMHTWRANYDTPAGAYSLSAYVVNQGEEVFYAQPEMVYPCQVVEEEERVWMPVVR